MKTQTEITSVVKMEGDSYKLNDAVIIENIDYTDDGMIHYKMHWDENKTTEEAAQSLISNFFNTAIKDAMENK